MNRTPIQEHTSAIIKGLIGETIAIKDLNHKALKGRLIELFTSEILSKFLTSQFGIGTGMIMNQNGDQSRQIDIIVYDKRILPPFIHEQIGVYPAECVLAIIEVRSWISKRTIKKYSEKAVELNEKIYNPASSLYRDYSYMRPLYSLVGFYYREKEKKFYENREKILQWMMNNAKSLFGVCLFNKFSWLNLRIGPSLKMVDGNNEETKAFIAVLLDNIRTVSQRRYLSLGGHTDWLSIYIRDQSGIIRGPSGIRIKK